MNHTTKTYGYTIHRLYTKFLSVQEWRGVLTIGISVLTLAVLSLQGIASALPPDQKAIMDANIRYFNIAVDAPCPAEGDVGGGGLVPIVGSDDAEKVYNFLVGKGLKPFQAAGVMGNMQVESGIQPMRLQNTRSGVKTPAETVGNRNIGWGLVQWTPASKFIGTQTPPSKANDIGVQLEFLWGQLEGRPPLPEKRAGDDLKATTTIEQAVLAFQGNRSAGGQYTGYERPKDQSGSVPERTAAARGYLAKYGSNAAAGAFAGVTVNASASTSGAGCPAGTPPAAGTGGTSIPTGDTIALAKQILAKPNVISFQTTQGKAAFDNIAATGKARDCGAPTISPKLLGVILKLSESYKLVLGGFLDGRGSCSDGQHPLGRAIDINGVNPLTGPEATGRRIGDGPGTAKFDPEEMAILTQFYKSAGDILAANGGGGLGEQQCFTGPVPKVAGVTYFNDTCDHIHMDARDT